MQVPERQAYHIHDLAAFQRASGQRRRGMRFTAIILVSGLLLLAGCSASPSITERCAAINAQFTNGTPLSQVVAKLGQPDTRVASSFLGFPENTNLFRLCVYHFDSGDIIICSTGGPPMSLDLNKRKFLGAIVDSEKK
jgi:hypothetical protein